MKIHTWLLPTIVFSVLVVLGATAHPLWGDEAETALFARNILRYGVPRGWDGVNIMGINNAVVLNKNLINHTSPWAQYYLTAASFAIFGQSSFTARIPSIVLSILSLPILYVLALTLTKSKRVAALTTWIVSLSVPFILFSYQARYYSLVSFASLLMAYSSLYLGEKKLWPKMGFVLSGVLFFYGNYVAFVAFYVACFLAVCIYRTVEKQTRIAIARFMFWYILLGLVIAAFCAPWYIMLGPFTDRGTVVLPGLFRFLQFFFVFFAAGIQPYNLNNGFPLVFVFVVLAVFIVSIRKGTSVAPFALAFAIPMIFMAIMSAFTVVADVDTSFVHNRYTMLIFPYLSMTVALLIDFLWKRKRTIAVLVLGTYLFTNLFTLHKPRSFLLEFIGEVVHPYPTPDKVVADYLARHAKDRDTAFVSLDRDHEPLIFHLKDKIRFVDRVSLINTRIFPENRGTIPRYIYDFRDEPDWIILYSKRGDDGSFLTFDYRPVGPEIDLSHYEEISLPVFFADMSRPEIELRSFKNINPSYTDQVFVYQKKP